jgi:hypothetical protein
MRIAEPSPAPPYANVHTFLNESTWGGNQDNNIDALHILDDGRILFSTSGGSVKRDVGGELKPEDFPGGGRMDIFLYDPATGLVTIPSNLEFPGISFPTAFAADFKGKLDALHVLEDGSIIFSTLGGASIQGTGNSTPVAFNGNDLIHWDGTTATKVFVATTQLSSASVYSGAFNPAAPPTSLATIGDIGGTGGEIASVHVLEFGDDGVPKHFVISTVADVKSTAAGQPTLFNATNLIEVWRADDGTYWVNQQPYFDSGRISPPAGSSNDGHAIDAFALASMPPVISDVAATETAISFDIADTDSTSFELSAPFAAAFGDPTLALGSNTIAPMEQTTTALSGTLVVNDGAGGAARVIGLYLGTSGNNTGVTAPLAALPNAMYGFGGNDNLTGGTAADFLFGGAGTDTLTGGAGADFVSGGAGTDTINLAINDFVAGEVVDGGAESDTITLTTSGDNQILNLTVGTVTNVENLTSVNQGGGNGYDQTFTVTASQWAALTTVDMNDGADVLNVLASGDISGDVTLPTVSDVETGNLTGTNGSDSVTLTGTQLNAILIGAGTINLGAGTADTINLTSTSTELNALSNTALTNTEIISAATATSDVKINLNVQAEAFTIIGGSGNDTLVGGSGNDTLTGNLGADQFRLRTNGGEDTLTDYTDGTDGIGFLEGAGTGAVDFATAGTATGATLGAGDFVSRTSITNIQAADDNKIISISAALTETEITTQVGAPGSNPLNSYVLVFNSTTGRGEIWFDTDWDSTSGRTQIATLNNITTLAQLTAITASDIVVYSSVTDPVILDLDNNGYTFSDLANGVSFDINADGAADRLAWNTSNDGILAMDLDGDGVIDDGSELFTPDFNGGAFASGGEALASLDDNGDGVIDTNDAAFDDLSIWQDANADGVTDAGELKSLAEHGITSITAPAAPASGEIDGQTIIGEGSFTRGDGTTGGYVEVALETEFGFLAGSEEGEVIFGEPGMADTLTGTDGADTFVLDDLTVADFIADFGEADSVDLTSLFEVLEGGELGEHVAYDSATGELRVDTDGAGGNEATTVATVTNLPASLTIIFNDDGSQVTTTI